MTLKAVLKSMRLPFLMLTPACVLLGVATAVVGSEAVIWSNLWLESGPGWVPVDTVDR